MAKKKPNTTIERFQQANVGIIAGNRVPEPFSRSAALREYSSWCASAADRNAYGIGQIPLRLYVRDKAGTKLFPTRKISARKKRYLCGDMARHRPSRSVTMKALDMGGDFVEVTEHPALDLLYSVNPWMCSFEMLVLKELHLDICGNAYWFKLFDGVAVSELWPLPPQFVHVIPGRGNYIEGYEYRTNQSGETITFAPEEIIHFRLPNPRSQWYGMGFIEKAWLSVLGNRARHESDLAFWENYARPDFIWILKNAPQTTDIDGFTSAMQKKLQGHRKTGRHVAVTGDVDLRPMQFPPKDNPNETPTIEEIAAAAGVPVSMLMANDPNLASAQTGYAWWREQTVAPRCRLSEDMLNQNLLRDFDPEGDSFFAYDDPMVDNEEADSVIEDRAIKSGKISINEARADDGMDPSDDPMADELLFNGQKLGMAMAMPLGLAGTQQQPGQHVAAMPVDGQKPADQTQPVADAKPQNATASVASDPGAAVQDTALNGAQVTSLVALASQARDGTLPVDTAQAIAGAAFPLMTPEELSAIFNPIRSAPPLPKPEPLTTNPGAMNGALADSAKNPIASTGSKTPSTDESARPSSQKAMLFTGKGCSHTKDMPQAGVDDPALNEFLAKLSEIGRRQAVAMIDALRRQGLRGNAILTAVELEARRADWVSELALAAKPYIELQVQAGGAQGAAVLPGDFAFEFTNPEVSRYVDSATVKMAKGVNETTVLSTRAVLGTMLEEGKTIDEMAVAIRDNLSIDPARAEMIARTESAKAFVHGQVEAWKQSEVVTGKTWLLAPDACEFCRAASRQSAGKPIPLDQPFYRMGETLQGVSGGTFALDYEDIDGPPLHPGCRCDVMPVLAEG